MKSRLIIGGVMLVVIASSCVSKKKFMASEKAAQDRYTVLSTKNTELEGSLKTCNDDKVELNRKNTGL